MQQQFEEITTLTVMPLASVAAPAEAIQTTTTPIEATSSSQTGTFDALLVQMEQENQRSRQRIQRMSRLSLYSLVLPAIYIAVIFLYFLPRHLLVPIWPNFVYMALMMFAPFLSAGKERWYRRYAAQMTQMEDTRVVGPLIDYLIDGKLHSAVEDALTRLLPRVQASDVEQFTPARRDRLCRELARNRCALLPFQLFRQQNPAYAVAILKAFEQVGGDFELPEVRALTNGSIKGVSPSVRAAAHECLPFLEQRVHAQQSRVELLRAVFFYGFRAVASRLRHRQRFGHAPRRTAARPDRKVTSCRHQTQMRVPLFRPTMTGRNYSNSGSGREDRPCCAT